MQEAPFSWNVAAIHKETGAREQFTVRGDRWLDIVDGIKQVRTYWENQGYAPVADGSGRAFDHAGKVVPTGAMPPPLEEPPDELLGGAAPAPAGPPAQSSEPNVIKIDRIVIKPQPNGQADLEFWQTGRKFPELKQRGTPDRLVSLMAPTGAWKPEHFAKASDVAASLLVTCEPSKNLNTKGEPYKNVVKVRRA